MQMMNDERLSAAFTSFACTRDGKSRLSRSPSP